MVATTAFKSSKVGPSDASSRRKPSEKSGARNRVQVDDDGAPIDPKLLGKSMRKIFRDHGSDREVQESDQQRSVQAEAIEAAEVISGRQQTPVSTKRGSKMCSLVKRQVRAQHGGAPTESSRRSRPSIARTPEPLSLVGRTDSW